MISTKEASSILRVHPATVRRLAARGVLRHRWVGSFRSFTRLDVARVRARRHQGWRGRKTRAKEAGSGPIAK